MRKKKSLGNKKETGNQMKVLYIGCYRDGTGWAQAAIDYILAMDAAGIDVVPRAIKLNSNNPELPKRIVDLESKDSLGSDVCIQHVLPHMMDYNAKFKKNIALYASETSNFIGSNWARKINCMDEAWVINNQMIESAKESGVTIPIKIVPHATDFSKFESNHKKIDIPNIKDNFTFYFIGEMNNRKNLAAFIKAFHLEFDPNEQVSILIKSNRYGMSPEECASEIKNVCDRIKLSLKKYKNLEDYKEDLIITDYLSEVELYGLHRACDCFVMPSYGEAWSIPAFDAMGFGKTPICTNTGGMADYIGDSGILVDGRWEPVSGMNDTFTDLFTGEENWYSVDINKLKKAMRKIYEMRNSKDSEEYTKMKRNGLLQATKYSHDEIGKLIKGLLDE
jgi:glycosyltransferase involved in cell wall biosynthesis